ncbi:MAG: YcxB family protein [Clostridia bacterium]|nr:YcxB family protein [Clostridia bacterium]
MNLYVFKSKKLTLFTLAIADFAIALEFILFLTLGWNLPSVAYTVLVVTVAIDFFYLFIYFIAPRISLKKNKALGSVIEYSFSETTFTVKAKNKYIDESSTLRYSSIEKIGNDKKYLYLFIASSTAYIVDLSGISREEALMLRDKISSFVDPKKIKWKI